MSRERWNRLVYRVGKTAIVGAWVAASVWIGRRMAAEKSMVKSRNTDQAAI